MNTDVLEVGTDFAKKLDVQTACAATEQDDPRSMAELLGVSPEDAFDNFMRIINKFKGRIPSDIDEDAILAEKSNPAICAMERFQNEMAGEWEKAGIYSEADLDALMREIRLEVESV
ncbi:MAG: hypothetical protein LBM98_07035 [Oscillospiraceae bacterium]|jgi:hypothetical protein|nr:hypothetical protein [Oscillospiraceae bacterium]